MSSECRNRGSWSSTHFTWIERALVGSDIGLGTVNVDKGVSRVEEFPATNFVIRYPALCASTLQ